MWILIIILMAASGNPGAPSIGTIVANFRDREACDAAWHMMQLSTRDFKAITQTVFACLPDSSMDPSQPAFGSSLPRVED